MPTEKNSSRASILISLQRQVIYQIKAKKTKLPYERFYFIEFKKALKFFALELGGIEFTSEAPALSRC